MALEELTARPLGDVRIHVDESAARAADEIDARAFAVGRDIFFGAGEFSPDTPSGDRLIAHEVAHTVQHPIAPVVDGDAGPRVSEPSDASEASAEHFADAFVAGAVAPGLPIAGAAGLLRTPRGAGAAPTVESASPVSTSSTTTVAGDAGAPEVVGAPSAEEPTAASVSVAEEPAPRPRLDAAGEGPAAPAVVSRAETPEPSATPEPAAAEAQPSAAGAHPLLVALAQQRALVVAHGEAEAGRAQVAQGPAGAIAQARVVFQAQAELQRTLARNEIEAARLAFDAGVAAERRGLLLAAQAESLRVRQSAHEQAEEIPAAAALQVPAITAAAIAATRGASIPERVRPQVEAAVTAVANEVVTRLAARAEQQRLRVRRNAAAVADAIQASARGMVARLDARSAEIARAWGQAQQALLARIGQREEVGLRAFAALEARARGSRAAEAGRQVAGARATARAIGAEMLRAESAIGAQLRNLPPGGQDDEAALAPALEAVQAYGARGRDLVSAAAQQRSAAPGGELAGALAEATLMLVHDGAAARAALRGAVQERSLEAVASIRADAAGARSRWRSDADRAIATTAADTENAVAVVSATTARLGHRFSDEAKRAAAEAQLSQGDRIWAAIRHSMSTNLLYLALAGLAVVGVAALLELSLIATGIAAFTLALKLVGLSAMATMLVLALVKRLGSLGQVPGFGDMPWYEQALRVVGATAAAAGDATLVGPAAEAATGRDLVTGRELTPEERAGLATDVVMGVLTAYLGHALHKGVQSWTKTTPPNELPRKAPPVLTEESLAASEAERAALEAADGVTTEAAEGSSADPAGTTAVETGESSTGEQVEKSGQQAPDGEGSSTAGEADGKEPAEAPSRNTGAAGPEARPGQAPEPEGSDLAVDRATRRRARRAARRAARADGLGGKKPPRGGRGFTTKGRKRVLWGNAPREPGRSAATGGLKGHFQKHPVADSPPAYYEQAVENMNHGKRFRVYHDGEFKNAYITDLKNGRYRYTGATLNNKKILTHLEVEYRELRKMGITLGR